MSGYEPSALYGEDGKIADRRQRINVYRPNFWQRFATWALEWAERFFLHAHGWESAPPEFQTARDRFLRPRARTWSPPDGYPFKRHPDYVRSHAVNSQKQAVYNAVHGGTRRDPDFR